MTGNKYDWLNDKEAFTEYQDLTWRAEKVAALVTLGPELLNGPKLENAVEVVNGLVRMQFYTFLYTRKLSEFKVEKPATAWDHFKLEYFPGWLLDYFPVKWNIETYEALGNLDHQPFKGETIRFRKTLSYTR